MILAGAFHREGSQLAIDEKLALGIRLAGMMIDDDEPKSAVTVLTQIQSDADRLPEVDPTKAAFWQMQSRCFTALCAYDQAIEAIGTSLKLTRDQYAKDRLRANLAEIHFLQGNLDKALNVNLESRSPAC